MAVAPVDSGVTLKHGRSRDSGPSSELDEGIQHALLTALSDPDCRTILRAASDRALTAPELSEALDIPLSTIYRKLDRLADTSLLEGTRRLTCDGKHPREYRCVVDRIHIELSGADERLLTSTCYYAGGAPPDRVLETDDGR